MTFALFLPFFPPFFLFWKRLNNFNSVIIDHTIYLETHLAQISSLWKLNNTAVYHFILILKRDQLDDVKVWKNQKTKKLCVYSSIKQTQ